MDFAPGYKSILTCNTIQPLTTWSSSLQNTSVMASSFSIAASFAGAASLLLSSSGVHAQVAAAQRALPAKAQIIDQKSFNVLEVVPPPLEFNASSEFLWPGVTHESLTEKPFHIYDPEFYDIIGSDPSLTLIATSETDPIFHEAVVWYPPTEEVFFVQNAGPPAAGTGLNKSSIVQKIRLADAEALRNGSLGTKEVTVTTVPSIPQVINPNGGTNYKGQIIFAGEGQGDRVPSSLYLMNPVEPYNTTILVNNYFGRQFNSLNDVVVSRRNGDIYFTDTQYGYWQNFRPAPGLPNQVYRLNPTTGALTVVTDEFVSPNGITLSPDGTYAYVTDTGISQGQFGTNFTKPATVYRFEVKEDGTFENRKIFAHTSARLPDGVHCDSKGNVYAGCNDGVHVWNPSGKLIGKIYTGTTAANFQFAGDGRMVITGQTKLFYATFAASGVALT
ncbi:D-lactonohydrolase [Colletotrichum tamarilloi]|uniref:D-lactonohydrolase n=1 Tax=Colletotrichum tamarilloi TaxID=1209934 RepID=A0ABQ9R2C7_9PEZI|nr:D-lactonohydrolase [Colletotrichum tamarilloi]KAK1492647.1 D-lactonohydrolase [Colletotrichum tamarilloi]